MLCLLRCAMMSILHMLCTNHAPEGRVGAVRCAVLLWSGHGACYEGTGQKHVLGVHSVLRMHMLLCAVRILPPLLVTAPAAALAQVRMSEGALPPLVLALGQPSIVRNMAMDSDDIKASAALLPSAVCVMASPSKCLCSRIRHRDTHSCGFTLAPFPPPQLLLLSDLLQESGGDSRPHRQLARCAPLLSSSCCLSADGLSSWMCSLALGRALTGPSCCLGIIACGDQAM